MASSRTRPFGQNYAYVVVAVIFVSLLCTAGLRSAPGVLMVPWEKTFGWQRQITSLAAAIGLALFGLVGPFAAALMQTLGIRKTMLGALTVMTASCLLSLF
ncbi:MAG: MFS transporter, partial [Caulobacteraceae bacterium]